MENFLLILMQKVFGFQAILPKDSLADDRSYVVHQNKPYPSGWLQENLYFFLFFPLFDIPSIIR
ncbi:hypothetical protein AB9N12_02975 [Bacteroides sp. AN502(2024)]|uniref:hypothetical protein n=1 Tax=Bacteroides sp. AN502(2024) TaxID=3160599 RepID=UPI0035119B18